jgi:hypothetical protein
MTDPKDQLVAQSQAIAIKWMESAMKHQGQVALLREALEVIAASPAAQLAYVKEHRLAKPDRIDTIDWDTHIGWTAAIVDYVLDELFDEDEDELHQRYQQAHDHPPTLAELRNAPDLLDLDGD